MRFLRQSLTGLFLLALTLAGLLYAGVLVKDAVQDRMSQEPRIPQARERIFTVNVVPAQGERIAPVMEAYGAIASRRELQIRAAAAGRLVELSEDFEDGAAVTAGQVLARLDPAPAQAALDRADADLMDAEAERRDAERALEIARDTLTAAEEQAELRAAAFRRQSDLRDRGVGSAALVEEAELAASSARQSVLSSRSALAQAEARVDQADTSLARARLTRADLARDLEDLTITAPFNGTLSEVAGVEGGLVSGNEQLALLVDGDALEVAFRVSTPQYALLLDASGDLRDLPVTVTLDVYGVALQATGRISRDSAAVMTGQSGRQLYARLDQARGLKPGDFVTVAIEEPPLDNVVRLPATAMNAAGQVLVVGSDERLEPVMVELVRQQGDDILVRGDGLEGRAVVAERTPLLGAGIRVRPVYPAGREPRQEAAVDDAELIELTDDRRARLIQLIEANPRMPEDVKARILGQLSQQRVPAKVVARIEDRMGG
ncbi:efflux RND transporter periplasmic adaptor subunit [Maritimibacter alkaliphilus]|uniref:efflux RND transporter periplasmic adaptor subunit n=1 Tax=Maritimibacter alkaliphilus TaxID=404236 RepID=UPI001C95FF2D|nr:HlyD family efflux transporter periplasmic adaptor subunit [Maritimibacter alkaliphilus]MBY6092435.1 HlyD family efflux transporter periplasmic adaptor subunit [Maritimibacter alkaliphilus]